jgi:hypothetical protein
VDHVVASEGHPGAVRRVIGGLACGVALVLLGCSSASTGGAPASPSSRPSRPTQPLTGLPSSGGAQAARPALFAKIENAPQARPQSGLDKADVVYEAVAEGGITRFAAIFQSTDPGIIGPMRSVRPQDPDLAAPLHGIAAYSGGVAPIVADLSSVAQNLSSDTAAGAPAYQRSTDRAAPHNRYADASKLWAAAAAPYDSPPPALFRYGALAAGGQPATTIAVAMSPSAAVSWSYDKAARVYRRSQDGVAFTVTGTGRIGPANVLLQTVQIADAGYQDVAGAQVPKSVVVGSGRAQLFRDGVSYSGTWARASRDAGTTFTADDGSVMLLRPGRTWVELVPAGAGVNVKP